MLVTLLIPCHNEVEALPPLFAELDRLPKLIGPHHFPEILFVDDGSNDGTPYHLQEFADRSWTPVRVLGLEPNRGIGSAIREGAPLAAGDVVVTYDADRAYPLEDIAKLLAALETGFDLATASPWHAQGRATDLQLHRAFLSRTVSALYRIRLGRRAGGLRTFTCGFRAYRRELLLACLPRHDRFTATAEILLNALAAHARVSEIPSELRNRTEGKSKMRALRTAIAHLALLLRPLRTRPGGSDADLTVVNPAAAPRAGLGPASPRESP